MSRVIITEGAVEGLDRCRLSLSRKNPKATIRAGETIAGQLALLEADPYIGRPLDDLPELRELVIKFGGSGYVGLYRCEKQTDTVYLLAYRHQKEAGY